MRKLGLAVAPIVLGLAAGIGCARTAEERQLEAMRSDIERLREDRDHADKPALATELAEPTAPGSVLPAAPPPEPPLSPVVRLGALGDPPPDDYADPDDSTPRPRIRVFGSPRLSGSGRQVEQLEDVADPASAAPSLDPQAKRAYDEAVTLVGAKRYDEALDAFAAFLVRWPDHPYADHAMFWRGECYFARGEYGRAAEQLEGVLARFPAGSKAPDALLKLGMTYKKLSNPAKARQCFARLLTDFPQTDAAHRIPTEGRP